MENKAESLMGKGSFWLPRSVSTVSDNVDQMFNVITWGSAILFVAIILVGIYFLLKYKKSDKNSKAAGHMLHNTALELSWTVIPMVIMMFIFAYGYRDYLKLSV